MAATDEAGTKYLEEKSSEAGVVTLPSGLRYKVLEKGKGAFHPKVNSPCLCHYGGTLIDGTGERYVLIMYQCEVLLNGILFSKKYCNFYHYSRFVYLLIWVQSLIVRIVEGSLQHLLLTKLSKGENIICCMCVSA